MWRPLPTGQHFCLPRDGWVLGPGLGAGWGTQGRSHFSGPCGLLCAAAGLAGMAAAFIEGCCTLSPTSPAVQGRAVDLERWKWPPVGRGRPPDLGTSRLRSLQPPALAQAQPGPYAVPPGPRAGRPEARTDPGL